MRKQVGPFELDVWSGGYPCWVWIKYENAGFRLHHDELRDLEHVVREARIAVDAELAKQKSTDTRSTP